jgi:hypothetical protein
VTPRPPALPGLFDQGTPAAPLAQDDLRARTSDPPTSRAAMETYEVEKVSEAMAVVRALLREHPGGLADFELAARFPARYGRPCHVSLHQQARNQLRNRGLVRASGRLQHNPTSGMQQIVWEACEAAPPALHRCPTCGHVARVKEPPAAGDTP